jgi:hypothetical protein
MSKPLPITEPVDFRALQSAYKSLNWSAGSRKKFNATRFYHSAEELEKDFIRMKAAVMDPAGTRYRSSGGIAIEFADGAAAVTLAPKLHAAYTGMITPKPTPLPSAPGPAAEPRAKNNP